MLDYFILGQQISNRDWLSIRRNATKIQFLSTLKVFPFTDWDFC